MHELGALAESVTLTPIFPADSFAVLSGVRTCREDTCHIVEGSDIWESRWARVHCSRQLAGGAAVPPAARAVGAPVPVVLGAEVHPVWRTPLENCSGACTDTRYDPANCGSCGAACASLPNTDQGCSNGTCLYGCSSGTVDCNGDLSDGCNDLSTDASNCGACGNACSATCVSSLCTTPCPGLSGSGSNGGSGTTCLQSRSFRVIAGQTYTISTCGSYSGDPYLVVSGACSCRNDDGCGFLGSTCSCTATSTGTATICASTWSTSSASWNYTISGGACW